MNLENLVFAVVMDCNPSGCRVRLTGSDEIREAGFAPEVFNKVKIRPGQLAAVNMAADPPEIVWRWYCARIVSATDTELVVDERKRRLQASRAPGLAAELAAGDQVWVGGVGEGAWEALDRLSQDGELSRPESARAHAFAMILEAYQGQQP
jgi:hypothetical protein